jgi:mannose-6-phosphate isomerase
MIMSGFILDPSNFTPKALTPWAGDWIWHRLKKHLPQAKKQVEIGESWEFSFDPKFSSRVKGTRELLSEVIKDSAQAIFGPKEFLRLGNYSDILIKVIHASRPLSLQVHPSNHFARLAGNESGKPESWLILDAEKGAGVYIGFSMSITKTDLKRKLASGEDITDLLQFVPVAKGDFFELSPGVPHALGSNVLVFEPQSISKGKSGKTYRIWDWGLRYDEHGNQSPAGKPRELHIDEALELIDPEVQVGPTFLESVRRRPKVKEFETGLRLFEYPKSESYQVFLLVAHGGTVQKLFRHEGYCVAFVSDGSLVVRYRDGLTQNLTRGETILLGECSFPLELHVNGEICLTFSRGSDPVF